jgi:predicted anti-sigma-YlaC factor YlaD
MHQPIRDGLEAYLAGRDNPQFSAHLAACEACRRTVSDMVQQNAMLRSLRIEESDPSPGFYARVMERVEAQKRQSMWYLFLEPLFFRRLVYASLTLLLVLSGFLYTAGPAEDQLAAAPEAILAERETEPPVLLVDQEQDRNAVLVQLTSY